MHRKRFQIAIVAVAIGLVAAVSATVALTFAGDTPASTSFAAQETITQEELVRRTQELFGAVVPGNQEPWKKHYAEDAMFADEKGRSLNKTALVADITPMPKGYSGAIKVVRPQSRIFNDVAILSYDRTKPKPSLAKISKRVITKLTRGCDAMALADCGGAGVPLLRRSRDR